MNRDKELYKQLRALPWDKLWSEQVPRFNAATARERMERVAVIRAVGVVFAASGPPERLGEVKAWLHSLLRDSEEKIRRYAAAALPKIGADSQDEVELLAVAKSAATPREKEHIGKALGKIGGKETLKNADALPSRVVQRVRAKVSRSETPSVVSLDPPLSDFANVLIHLRSRSGLEKFVEEEATAQKLKIRERHRGLIIVNATKPLSLTDIFKMRCFDSVAFALNIAGDAAAVATSPSALKLLKSLTEGPIRYRIDFLDKGHQRAAVAKLAEQIHARQPELINGGGDTPWTLEIRGAHVQFAPKILPDPRFAYRRRDVPAASHPPLAACMARLAGRDEGDVIWDPFCGSGVELVERWMLGGVRQIIGTDLSAAAIEIARANLSAAGIQSSDINLVASDFRKFDARDVSLILTNPPMGRRVPIPDLRGLIDDLFRTAARTLRPGGRLVLANPVGATSASRLFHRDFSQLIDMGGFHCRLEKYTLLARKNP
ncbi:MAG TPA: methyltransferase [Verrucomicrobiae bacterium]|nr:methyltransferase [Verrucomicrobiae bacterium]